MEPSGRNRSQPVQMALPKTASNRRKPLPWVATGCRENACKEGVDGLSPSEGFHKVPANRRFVLSAR
jgi:hypothetical protein